MIPERLDFESRDENTGQDKIVRVSALDVSVSCSELRWPWVGGAGRRRWSW